jgi:hypothetical protein
MRVGKRLIAVFGLCVTLSVGGQDLSQVAEQSDVSKILQASGTLYVRESYDLSDITTTGGAPVECEVVIVKVLVGKDALSPSVTTVGIRLVIEEEYSERSAYIDMEEVEGLLASLRRISSEGMSILTTPMVDGINSTERSSEIHYTTKEEITLAAFDHRGVLRYALKISSLAEWAILTEVGVRTLDANLSRAIEIAAAVVHSEQ